MGRALRQQDSQRNLQAGDDFDAELLVRSLKEAGFGTLIVTAKHHDSFCIDAVLWAVEEDITTGTSATTFDPNGKCARAIVVTFLYCTLAK